MATADLGAVLPVRTRRYDGRIRIHDAAYRNTARTRITTG